MCVCVPESMSLFILVPVHVAAGPCCLLSYAKDILWFRAAAQMNLVCWFYRSVYSVYTHTPGLSVRVLGTLFMFVYIDHIFFVGAFSLFCSASNKLFLLVALTS